MVYRKRRTTRRTFKRRTTRSSRKRMVKPRFGGKIQQPVHYFTRFGNKTSISGTSGTTNTYGQIHFELADLPSFAEYTALYDFFKINAVKVMFIPLSNVTLLPFHGAATDLNYNLQTEFSNRFMTVIDYNDRNVPSDMNTLRQYSNCRVSTNNRVVKRFFHPKPTVAMDEDSEHGSVYGIAQTTGPTPWISTSSNQCEYYGLKYGIEHPSFTENVTLYRVEVKYYLSFKGRK